MNKGVNREGAHECGVMSHTCRSWVGKGTVDQLVDCSGGVVVVLDKAGSSLQDSAKGSGSQTTEKRGERTPRTPTPSEGAASTLLVSPTPALQMFQIR